MDPGLNEYQKPFSELAKFHKEQLSFLSDRKLQLKGFYQKEIEKINFNFMQLEKILHDRKDCLVTQLN
jgi:hypothetical protein